MMNVFLITTVLIVLCSALHLDNFRNGYVHGNSGDIILDDLKIPSAKLQLSWSVTGTSMLDTTIYNLLARKMALPQLEQSPLNIDFEVDLFQKQRGNMFFSVEALPSGLLSEDLLLLGKSQLVEVERSSTPYVPSATLFTALTGTFPESHGAVNGLASHTTSVNFFDVVEKLYGNDCNIIGASSSSAAIDALTSRLTNGFFWDFQSSKFTSVDGLDSSFSVGIDDIKILEQLDVVVDGTIITIDNITFDIKKMADSTLIGELMFVLNAAQILKNSQSSLQFLNFHFKSLENIGSSYGQTSETMIVAVKLIDRMLSIVTKQLDWSYEVLLLPAICQHRLEQTKEIVSSVLGSTTASMQLYPHIYLANQFVGDKATLCQSLRDILSEQFQDTIAVYCPMNKAQFEKRAIFVEEGVMVGNNTYPLYNVMSLHQVVWPSVILILVVIWGTYAIMAIPPDATLYQLTSHVNEKSHQK